MEGSKDVYMDMVELSMQRDVFERLINNGAISFSEFEIKYVEPKNYDYSKDPVWCALNSESLKAYKKKKDREFEIRTESK